MILKKLSAHFGVSGPFLAEVGLYLFAKALPGAIGLVAVGLLVRVAGVEAYGRYALWLALATLGGVLSSTWLSQSILRMTPTGGLHHDDLRRLRWRFGPWSFALSAAMLAGVLFASGVATAQSAAWACAFLVAFHLYSVELAVLQSSFKAKRFAAIEVTRSCLMLLLPLALASFLQSKSVGLLAGSALAYAGAWMVLGLLRAARHSSPHARAGSLTLGAVLSFGLPLSIWAGASQALSVIDRYVIAQILGDSAVGGYAAVYDVVVRGFAMVLFPVTMAVHPRIMQYAMAGQRAEARRVLIRAGLAHCLLGALVIPVGVALNVILTNGILRLPSAEFSGLVLPLLLGAFLWQIALLVHKPLEMTNSTHFMLAGMLVAVGVALVSNLLLVPAIGLMGAALSTVISALSYILFVVVAQRRSDARV